MDEITRQRLELTRGEIEHLNAVVEQLQFKIPDLWDRNFLDSRTLAFTKGPGKGGRLATSVQRRL